MSALSFSKMRCAVAATAVAGSVRGLQFQVKPSTNSFKALEASESDTGPHSPEQQKAVTSPRPGAAESPATGGSASLQMKKASIDSPFKKSPMRTTKTLDVGYSPSKNAFAPDMTVTEVGSKSPAPKLAKKEIWKSGKPLQASPGEMQSPKPVKDAREELLAKDDVPEELVNAVFGRWYVVFEAPLHKDFCYPEARTAWLHGLWETYNHEDVGGQQASRDQSTLVLRHLNNPGTATETDLLKYGVPRITQKSESFKRLAAFFKDGHAAREYGKHGWLAYINGLITGLIAYMAMMHWLQKTWGIRALNDMMTLYNSGKLIANKPGIFRDGTKGGAWSLKPGQQGNRCAGASARIVYVFHQEKPFLPPLAGRDTVTNAAWMKQISTMPDPRVLNTGGGDGGPVLKLVPQDREWTRLFDSASTEPTDAPSQLASLSASSSSDYMMSTPKAEPGGGVVGELATPLSTSSMTTPVATHLAPGFSAYKTPRKHEEVALDWKIVYCPNAKVSQHPRGARVGQQSSMATMVGNNLVEAEDDLKSRTTSRKDTSILKDIPEDELGEEGEAEDAPKKAENSEEDAEEDAEPEEDLEVDITEEEGMYDDDGADPVPGDGDGADEVPAHNNGDGFTDGSDQGRDSPRNSEVRKAGVNKLGGMFDKAAEEFSPTTKPGFRPDDDGRSGGRGSAAAVTPSSTQSGRGPHKSPQSGYNGGDEREVTGGGPHSSPLDFPLEREVTGGGPHSSPLDFPLRRGNIFSDEEEQAAPSQPQGGSGSAAAVKPRRRWEDMSSDSDVQTDPSPRSSDKEALKGGGAEGSADTTGAGAYVHLYDTRPWAEQTSDSDQGAGGPGPAALGERALGTLPQGGQPEPAAAGTQTTPKANKNGNGNRLDGQENLL